jgi:hypothetical protein
LQASLKEQGDRLEIMGGKEVALEQLNDAGQFYTCKEIQQVALYKKGQSA